MASISPRAITRHFRTIGGGGGGGEGGGFLGFRWLVVFWEWQEVVRRWHQNTVHNLPFIHIEGRLVLNNDDIGLGASTPPRGKPPKQIRFVLG